MQPFYRKISIALPAAALFALAGAVRAADVSREYFCEDIKKPFFSVSDGPGGTKKIRTARPRSLPAEFLMPKPENTARVFIVGESAARLLGSGGDSLAPFLNKAFPGKKMEIINCGMGAYDSRRILPVAEEALSYSPDLLIVLSGNNENGREFCPDLAAEFGRRARKIKIGLASLSLPREEAGIKVSLAIHEERLRAMSGLARKTGTPVLFCSLPSNLRDFAPDGVPPTELAEGIRLAGKDPARALKFFESRAVPNEPFALFYSGRALEGLGRTAEAARNYAAALKYDPASDRCSADRNAMIRKTASEEGGCLADLDAAFSGLARGGITGGAELADGVHWFPKYNAFVSAVIGRAARTCPSLKGKDGIPAPKALTPLGGTRADEFKTVLSYACAYAGGQAAAPDGKDTANERAVVMLERLCRMDCGKLERLLFDQEALEKEIKENEWSPSLRGDAAAWRPVLLRSAEEMFIRAGRFGPAARAAAELPASTAKKEIIVPTDSAPAERPLRKGESEARLLSDRAVKKMLAGDLAGAGPLLEQAAKDDGDSLEIRLNACYLASRTRNAAFGEEHCGEAVYLAANPPKHASAFPEGKAVAFYSRANFRLETGNKAACEDLDSALKAASPAWDLGAEARALAARRCPGRR